MVHYGSIMGVACGVYTAGESRSQSTSWTGRSHGGLGGAMVHMNVVSYAMVQTSVMRLDQTLGYGLGSRRPRPRPPP